MIGNNSNIIFLRNRVREINELCTGCKLHQVTNDPIPADLIPRGLKRTNFAESNLWVKGSNWLNDEEACWPTPKFETSIRGELTRVEELLWIPG